MSVDLLRQVTALLSLVCAGVGSCYALTVTDLQHLLQSVPSAQAVPFHEVRESPWLATPVESRGTLHSSPERLEKRVETPRPETWVILADRMEWIGPNNVDSKQVLFSGVPAVAALAEALRRVIAGNLVALARNFRIEIRGDEHLWIVKLQPRSPEVARSLDYLELRGAGALLQVIIVAESQGERTTTRLRP